MNPDRYAPGPAQLRLWALIGAVGISLLFVVTALMYHQAFTPTTTVTLVGDRAGLLLDRGAQVRLAGVPVGRVTHVAQSQGQAHVKLAIEKQIANSMAANLEARIVGTSLFGPKKVELVLPAAPAGTLQAGQHITANYVTDEVNDLLEQLQEVMEAAPPQQVAQLLTNTADALQGRGTNIGELVTRIDAYLEALEPHLPQIEADLAASSTVLDAFSQAAPDFLAMLDNITVTSDTLVDTEASLKTVLMNFADLSHHGAELAANISFALPTALEHLQPVSRLLHQYSPALTCIAQGLNTARIGAERATAAQVSALQMRVVILPSQQPYKYPRDLPKLIRGVPPSCYEAPLRKTPPQPTPRYQFDDGTHAYDGTTDALTIGNPIDAFEQLFGVALAMLGDRG